MQGTRHPVAPSHHPNHNTPQIYSEMVLPAHTIPLGSPSHPHLQNTLVILANANWPTVRLAVTCRGVLRLPLIGRQVTVEKRQLQGHRLKASLLLTPRHLLAITFGINANRGLRFLPNTPS